MKKEDLILNTGSLIIASIAIIVVLVLVYGFLYLTEKKGYILYWCFGWLMMLIAYSARFYTVAFKETEFMIFLNYLASIGSYSFIFWGTNKFLQIGASLKWLIGLVPVVICFISGHYGGIPFKLHLIPTAALTSLAYAWLGFKALKIGYGRGKIITFLGWSFIIWGVIMATYPLYRTIEILNISIGYLIVGAAGFNASITILAAFFPKIGDDLMLKDQKIKYLGMYDKLTGVFSRAYFEELLKSMDTAKNLPLSVVIGDLNCLKLVNDTFGHHRGDELIVDAVKTLKKSCRKGDIIARWGGDEFIILLPKTGFESAQSIISQIKESCKGLKPEQVLLDISLGAATKLETHSDFSTVLKDADEQMYRNKLIESKNLRTSIISFLEKVMWEKDYQTEEHVKRLKELVKKTGCYLGLSAKEVEELSLVAALHDIGKIAVPVEILNKPGPLTPEEWDVMKRHPETGYRIAQSARELVHISDCILSHHECWNGKGYPQGLKGEEISLYARIIAVADSYDVMTHNRPYKKAISHTKALEEIKRCAGTQFDPEISRLFINMFNESIDTSSVFNIHI